MTKTEVRVRLNLYGNAILSKTFALPHMWDGLIVVDDFKNPHGDLSNIKLTGVRYIAELGYYTADGFPFGAPSNTPVADAKKLLAERGWKLEKK